MTKFLTLALLSLASPGLAQTAGAPPAPAAPAASGPLPAPTYATVRATLTTALGPIVLELESERAPLSTAAFLRYLDQRKLDGTSFYRAVNLAEGYGLVQFGTRGEARRTLPPIAHEPTSRTGLSHSSGTISLARAAPGTAQGDFFIVVGDLASLDAATAGAGGDPDGYAAFGRVVEGMDVVRRIMALPTDPNAGEGVMRGQIIAAPVRIESARRTPVVPTASPQP